MQPLDPASITAAGRPHAASIGALLSGDGGGGGNSKGAPCGGDDPQLAGVAAAVGSVDLSGLRQPPVVRALSEPCKIPVRVDGTGWGHPSMMMMPCCRDDG
jgi:hypothetical protein